MGFTDKKLAAKMGQLNGRSAKNLIGKKWQTVVDNVERLFESDIEDESIVLQGDLSGLKLLSVEGEDADLVLFWHLSNYFETGFLFVPSNTRWTSKAAFTNGQTFLIGEQDGVELDLPKLRFDEIKKGNARRLLKQLKLRHFDPYRKLNAYLLQPHPGVSYCLLTRIADPWLRPRLQELQSVLINHYGGR